MLIRKATAGGMLALWGYSSAEAAPPTARYFYGSLASGNAVFWTIDDGGDLIGELYAFPDIPEDRAFADGKTTACLCAFRVKKEYRGRGLGTRLMRTAPEELASMGFRRVTIGVDEPRTEAFYRRMGFTEEVKTCRFDPCARDERMQPVPDGGYLLPARGPEE